MAIPAPFLAAAAGGAIGDILIDVGFGMAEDALDNLLGGLGQVGKQAEGVGGAFALSINPLENINNLLTTTAGLVATAFAVDKLVEFSMAAIEVASDLDEVQNVVDTVFKSNAHIVDKFAKGAAQSFGMSTLAAKEYTSTMGAMLSSAGFTGAEATKMSRTITQLAGDIASFYNLDLDVAFLKLKSGMAGSTEPMQELGVMLHAASMEEFALAKGITKKVNAMGQQEKMTLRYLMMVEALQNAHGDFAKTNAGWSNQMRIISEGYKELQAVVGMVLIDTLLPFVQATNAIIKRLADFGRKWLEIRGLIGGGETVVPGEAIEGTVGGLGDIEDAAKKAKGQLLGFDSINLLKDTNKDADKLGNALDGFNLDGYEVKPPVQEAPAWVDKVGDALVFGLEKGLNAFDKAREYINKNIIEPFKVDVDTEGALSNVRGFAGNVWSILKDTTMWTVDMTVQIWQDIQGNEIVEQTLVALNALSATTKVAFDILRDALTEFYVVGLQPTTEWLGVKFLEALAFVAEESRIWGEWLLANKDGLISLAGAIGSATEGILKLLRPIGDKMWLIFRNWLHWIGEKLREFMEWCIKNEEKVAKLVAGIGVFVGIVALAVAGVAGLVAILGGALLAFTVLLNPVTWIGLAVGAVTVACTGLILEFQKLKENGGTVMDALKDKVTGVFKSIADTLKATTAELFNYLLGPVLSIFEMINTVIDGINGIKLPDWVGGGSLNLSKINTVQVKTEVESFAKNKGQGYDRYNTNNNNTNINIGNYVGGSATSIMREVKQAEAQAKWRTGRVGW